MNAGLLLTGGASRRLGVDKARLLAPRVAGVLRAALDGPVVEVGPGRTTLPCVPDDRPGLGPLAAVAAGVAELRRRGHAEGAVVLACDLPFVGEPLVRFLAAQTGTAVPVVGGLEQWLCARYAASALDATAASVAAGERRMQALAGDAVFLDEDAWSAVATARDFADVDTPEDAARLGVARA